MQKHSFLVSKVGANEKNKGKKHLISSVSLKAFQGEKIICVIYYLQ